MFFNLSLLKHTLAPALALLIAVLLANFIDQLPDRILFLLAYLPYFFMMLAGWLCFQFNQSRMLFSLLNIALIYFLMHRVDFGLLRLYEFLAVFWALLNITLLAQLPERSIISGHSLLKLGFMFIQALLSWYLLVYHFLLVERIVFSLDFAAPPEWINLSWLLLGMSSLALLLTLIKYLFEPGPIMATLLMFIALLVSLAVLGTQQDFMVCSAMAAGIAAFVAVIFDSHQMAYRDELTGLRSRRALNQYLTGLGRKYTIAMMDIDHFKPFNDNHGHDIGDQMLKLVASRIAKVRGGGTPFRFGGEEFTVVFPRRSAEDVMEHLETLRESIEAYPLVIRAKDRPEQAPKNKKAKKKTAKGEQTLSCTISIGLASRGSELKTPEQVMKGADEALYRAKDKGRNCVSV